MTNYDTQQLMKTTRKLPIYVTNMASAADQTIKDRCSDWVGVVVILFVPLKYIITCPQGMIQVIRWSSKF